MVEDWESSVPRSDSSRSRKGFIQTCACNITSLVNRIIYTKRDFCITFCRSFTAVIDFVPVFMHDKCRNCIKVKNGLSSSALCRDADTSAYSAIVLDIASGLTLSTAGIVVGRKRCIVKKPFRVKY